MGFAISYQTVLEIAIWHHHWVDPAGGTFALPPNPATAEALDRLFDYDVRRLLRIEPSPRSRDLIRRKGLIFRPTQRGGLLASRDTWVENDDRLRLTFLITVLDPQLLRHTDFGAADFKFAGRIFHLTNFGRSQAAPADRTLLTDGGGGTGQLHHSHFLPQRGRIVRLPQQTPGTATTIEVYDALSAATTPVLTTEMPAVAGLTEYTIDASALPEGRYRIESTNTPTTTLYLGLERMPGTIGVIDLFLKDWDEPIYDLRLAKT